MFRITRIAALLPAALLFTTVAACSSSTHSGAPATGNAGHRDATAIVAKFKTEGLPVGSTLTYTAASDANHLLGRLGGYTSKTSWTDTRIPADQTAGLDSGSVGYGGSVEVFADDADAKARAAYLSTILKAMPIIGTEYEYRNGNVLIRVSGLLTPEQAAAYKAG